MAEVNRTISIIGGGFCGLMTAIHLKRLFEGRSTTLLVFSDGDLGKGPAYSTLSARHLLNVEARNMSAYPDRPDHFVKWLSENGMAETNHEISLSRMFVPRKIYGDYLSEQARKLDNAGSTVHVKIIHSRATSVKHDGNIFTVSSDNQTYFTDYLVLATGNNPPSDPRGVPSEFLSSSRYHRNPWIFEPSRIQDKSMPVLIIGTGLTMVDTLLTLRESGFSNKITAVSPKGFEILPHRRYGSVSDIKEELESTLSLEELFSIFRKHIRLVREKGITGEAVVDAVRPLTQSIWKSLSEKDRKRFLTHLRHLWGLARHRLPPEQHEEMKMQMMEGKFEILAGRIYGITESDKRCTVRIREKKSGSYREIHPGIVINCTGPATDLTESKDPLFRSMLDKGIIQPDSLGMGLVANGSFNPLDIYGKETRGLFAVGNLLKGMLWESTAVPELRVQCEQVAASIATMEKINLED